MNDDSQRLPAAHGVNALIWLVPVLPLLAAAAIDCAGCFCREHGDAQEPRTAGLASGAALGALLLLLLIDTAALAGLSPTSVRGRRMVGIGATSRCGYRSSLDAWSLPMATLVR
jgi:hypothetical protein